jgi:hypothetical protein
MTETKVMINNYCIPLVTPQFNYICLMSSLADETSGTKIPPKQTTGSPDGEL